MSSSKKLKNSVSIVEKSSGSKNISETMPPFKKQKTTENIGRENDDESVTRPGENWREKCATIMDVNCYAWKMKVLTDVSFNVGEKSEVFHAHRLILALGSPVFEAMFFGSLADKSDSIVIPDVDPEGFNFLLTFLYFGYVKFKDYQQALTTALAADKYCITHLKRKCEDYLSTVEITPSNVWKFLEISTHLNLSKFSEKCFGYLKFKAEFALEHDTFLDVSMGTVEAFVCYDILLVQEAKLLNSVIRWVQHNNNVDDKDSFRNLAMSLLKHVRFGSLKAKDFVYFTEAEMLKEVLNSEDILAILKHIILPDMCVLPDWCCRKPRKYEENLPKASSSSYGERSRECVQSSSPKVSSMGGSSRKEVTVRCMLSKISSSLSRKERKLTPVFSTSSSSVSSSSSSSSDLDQTSWSDNSD